MASGSTTGMVVIVIMIIVVWIVAGVFITQANVKLPADDDDNDLLHKAYWMSFWAAFTTWTLVGLAILLLVFGAILGTFLFATGLGEADVAIAAGAKAVSGKQPKQISGLTVVMLVFSTILATITGVLSAITAKNINDYLKAGGQATGGASIDDLNKAKKDAIIASVLTLASVGVLIISIIGLVIYRHNQKKKIAEAAAKKSADNKEFAEEILQMKYGAQE